MSAKTLRMTISSFILGLVLWLAPSITANADDTEDLLNVYGLTLGGPIQSELEIEMKKLEENISSMQVQQTLDKEYNAILLQYIEERENKIDMVLNDISIYQAQNNAIVKDIGDNILTSDINSLLKQDSSYKTNTAIMNDLLNNLNSYKIEYSYRTVSYDIDEKEMELTKVQSVYAESLDTYNLGEVTNIDWILPNEMIKTSPYGYRVDPINPNNIRFHSGTDFRAAEGTPLGALFNGEVIAEGWSDTAGNFITVQSGDNIKYFVCHLKDIYVNVGDKVKQYEVIGTTGNTGSRTTGPHLHLALYLNGSTYDVYELFK